MKITIACFNLEVRNLESKKKEILSRIQQLEELLLEEQKKLKFKQLASSPGNGLIDDTIDNLVLLSRLFKDGFLPPKLNPEMIIREGGGLDNAGFNSSIIIKDSRPEVKDEHLSQVLLELAKLLVSKKRDFYQLRSLHGNQQIELLTKIQEFSELNQNRIAYTSELLQQLYNIVDDTRFLGNKNTLELLVIFMSRLIKLLSLS